MLKEHADGQQTLKAATTNFTGSVNEKSNSRAVFCIDTSYKVCRCCFELFASHLRDLQQPIKRIAGLYQEACLCYQPWKYCCLYHHQTCHAKRSNLLCSITSAIKLVQYPIKTLPALTHCTSILAKCAAYSD